jgi:hypothetical protein
MESSAIQGAIAPRSSQAARNQSAFNPLNTRTPHWLMLNSMPGIKPYTWETLEQQQNGRLRLGAK